MREMRADAASAAVEDEKYWRPPQRKGGTLVKIGKEGIKLEDTCSGGRIEDAEGELFGRNRVEPRG
jgi:hypothetical protein